MERMSIRKKQTERERERETDCRVSDCFLAPAFSLLLGGVAVLASLQCQTRPLNYVHFPVLVGDNKQNLE